MIKPPKLYLKRTDIPMQSLLDMDFQDSVEEKAGVYRSKGGGTSSVDNDVRSTTIKKDIEPKCYPDVCKYLVDMVNIWDPTLDPNDFEVLEFNYLKYGKGDKFKRHKDQIKQEGQPLRIYSTSTIVKTSDDLTGGDFIIWDHSDLPHTVELKPGETIFFDSTVHHEVTEVTKGNREVLVAWIYYK